MINGSSGLVDSKGHQFDLKIIGGGTTCLVQVNDVTMHKAGCRGGGQSSRRGEAEIHEADEGGCAEVKSKAMKPMRKAAAEAKAKAP